VRWLRRGRSDDPRAIARALDRSLARFMGASGDPVQFVGVVDTPEHYRAWQAAQRDAVPLLEPGFWPLVLWMMAPSAVGAFLRAGTVTQLYEPPRVGMFRESVSYPSALAAVISACLDARAEQVMLAPPLLATMRAGRPHAQIADLDRAWTLPPSEVVGIRR
jgi:hypothetical protein